MSFSPLVTMSRQNPEVSRKWVRPPLFWGLTLVGTIFSLFPHKPAHLSNFDSRSPSSGRIKKAIKLDRTEELAFSGGQTFRVGR